MRSLLCNIMTDPVGKQQKRDHPSPIREPYGPPYPGVGRGEPPWAAKRGRMEPHMSWGRGVRGVRGPGLDRYAGNRRSPDYDEAPRGSQTQRSPLWQGPPGMFLATAAFII